MKPVVKTSAKGGASTLDARLRELARKQVYVGIPESETTRQSGPVTNAGLLYIHTHGSALQGIPKRPVIEPAIQDAHAPITAELAEAAQAVLDGKPQDATEHLKRAGMLGANAAKRWFTNPANQWPPNSPETIARKGSARPLIDTGQLRRAIVYVLGEK